MLIGTNGELREIKQTTLQAGLRNLLHELCISVRNCGGMKNRRSFLQPLRREWSGARHDDRRLSYLLVVSLGRYAVFICSNYT